MARYEFTLEDINALMLTVDDLRQWWQIDFVGNEIGDPTVVINVDIDEETCVISTRHSTRSGKYAEAVGVKIR